MGARIDDCCLAIAEILRPIVGEAVYPAPPSLPDKRRIAVVFTGNDAPTYGSGGEQLWRDKVRVVVYAGKATTGPAMLSLDDLPEEIADAFNPAETGNSRLNNTVDFCQLVLCEMSQILEYAGVNYYGATFTLDVKRRRFAGEA